MSLSSWYVLWSHWRIAARTSLGLTQGLEEGGWVASRPLALVLTAELRFWGLFLCCTSLACDRLRCSWPFALMYLANFDQGLCFNELLMWEQVGSYSWQLLFKWQCYWKVFSFNTEQEVGSFLCSFFFALQVPRACGSGMESMLRVRDRQWYHWTRCEVEWVERGFCCCAPSLVGIPML